MREAQGARAPTQQLADRVSAIFVPVVVAIALITFVIWMFAADTSPVARATHAAVTVLIIACPCAMGLAVPAAIMVATGRGAEMGALFKGGDALERLDEIQTVVVDKTGTVTQGKPVVTEIVTHGGLDANEMLALAAALERDSEHPLGLAFAAAAAARGLTLATAESFTSRAGFGVTGVVDGHAVAIGNAALMQDWSVGIEPLRARAGELATTGATVSYVAIDGALAGLVAVSDPIRETSREAISAFRARGLDVAMVTGDSSSAGTAIARSAGIGRVVGGVLPEGKVAEIKRLQAEGRRVAMIGDGVNDAPALAQADVGIAMGSGTDVAITAADVTLMRTDLRVTDAAMQLSRRTRATMRQNLFWAFVYNVIGIPIAAGALYPAFGILLSPMVASAAMALSDVFVVGNSLRLRGFRPALAPTSAS
jgi:Cu+-exporting ATPase